MATRNILFFICALLTLPPHLAAQETLKFKEQARGIADRACPLYANNPEMFKEISDEEWKPCEFTFSGFRENEEPSKGRCYEQTIMGSAEPVKLTTLNSGGSCSSSSIAMIEEGDKPVAKFFHSPINSTVNGYGFGSHDKILRSFPNRVFVTNDAHSDLRLVTNEGVYVLCGFRYKLQGYMVSKWKRASVCEKFVSGEFEIPITSLRSNKDTVEDLEKEDSLYPGDLPGETHVSGFAEVDIDKDGEIEKLLALEMNSGSGCGCSLYSMSLEKSIVRRSVKDNELNDKLQKLTEFNPSYCHSHYYWSPIVIDSVAYIAVNASWPRIENAKEWTRETSARGYHDRVLYEYNKGDFEEVCRLKPNMKKVIDSEVIPSGAMNYRPIEQLN